MNFFLASEDSECIALMEAIAWKFPSVADLFFHIPNGGKRGKREGKKFKKMGVKKGIPDYFFSIAKGKYHGCYIEMKRREDWKISKDQIERIIRLRGQGYFVDVAEGWEDALFMVSNYMILKDNEYLCVKFLT